MYVCLTPVCLLISVNYRDRKERKDKLMSHIVSSTVDNTLPKEETVLTSKMKRSVPGTLGVIILADEK